MAEGSAGTQPGSNGTVLDVRGLQAPDNILAVLRKAGELAKGSTLEFLIDANPFQLYDLLQQRGYFLEMIPEKEGIYRGRVKERDVKALAH